MGLYEQLGEIDRKHSGRLAAQVLAETKTPPGQVITGYKTLRVGRDPLASRHDRYQTLNVPVFGRDPAAAEEDLRKEQARLAGIQQQAYETQQADIASQLKIVQGEKSAVSKMMEDYSNMLIAEAEAKKKAQEEERIALQTARANTAMAGRSGALQIQGAGATPRTSGTQQFRRRISQFGATSPYKGLSTIQSGMVNV